MGVDLFSPVAPVRLNILLLPAGRIKRSRFLSFAARLQAENLIRLGDISPDERPNRNMFTPLAFPNGIILYNISFSVPPTSHLELFPFEIFREPLVVIAIADGAELHYNEDTGKETNGKRSSGAEVPPNPKGLEDLMQELAWVKEQNPRALVSQLLIFDYEGLQKSVNGGPDDVIWVPAPEFSRPTTIKTVLCDITSLLLGEMDGFAKLMQSIPSIDSPKASSWGPRRGPELRPRPIDKLMHRMTMPAQFPVSNGDAQSATSSGRSSPAPGGHDSPTTFDEITRSIQVANRSATGMQSSKESSRDRMSVQGISAADRTKSRIKGRLGVVIGTLYLQAGRWPDALKELVEAATMARASSDYLWHGKALESILLCLLMLGWAGMDFQVPQICYPVAEKSSSKSSHSTIAHGVTDVASSGQSAAGNRLISLQNLTNLMPDLCNNILHLYNRAAVITDEPLPPLVFSETVIRLSRVLCAIRLRSGTLDDNALRHIVTNEALVPSNTEWPRGAPVLKKNDVANFLFRALPLSLGVELPVTDAAPILVGISSVLSLLDLPRKKALVLRELVLLMVPGLVEARKIGAAEIGIHPAAGLSTLNDAAFEINALDVGRGDMGESTRALLTMIGEIYGVQPSIYQERKKSGTLSRPPSAKGSGLNEKEYDSIASIVERAFRHVTLDGYGDLSLKIAILRVSINLCEALPDFEGVLQYTVELLQTIKGDLMLAEMGRNPPVLPPDEQMRLLSTIKRTVGAAHKLGATHLESEYWDDFLVRGVTLLEFPEFKRLFRRTKKDLSVASVADEKSKKDPFLYNAFAKTDYKTTEALMIAKEIATFKVTLQNPYDFELEIESLQIQGNNTTLDAREYNIIVPPLSLYDVMVPAIISEVGQLNITGCIIKVRNCRSRTFPIFQTPWKPTPEVKLKRTGLAAKRPLSERPLSWGSTTSKDGKVVAKVGPETHTCSVKVIHQQPSVVVHSTSLSQSAIMLLEGETRSFDITLHNVSSCAVGFIFFTFQDSTTRQLQNALSNKDLLPAEIYELDLQLSSKPPLQWIRHGSKPNEVTIKAGERATFTVEVFGKPGLQDATVQIDYCHLGDKHDSIPETFYTRQLSIPITVTVNASVEVARCDLVPLSGDVSFFNKQMEESSLSSQVDKVYSSPLLANHTAQITSTLSHLSSESHCLVVLDLRNAWPNPLSVDLNVFRQKDEDETWVAVKGTIQPGQISRFILVLPRVFLDNPHAAIPILHSVRRQFVVSANKLTFEAEAATREAFWFREELLKRIQGSWHEESTGREGLVDFRSIRFTPRMVDAMRLEDVEVKFSLTSSDDQQPVTQVKSLKYTAKTNSFLQLKVEIQNRSSRTIHPLLRLQPGLCNQPSTIALDLSKRLAWTGTLQRALPVLPGGSKSVCSLGLIFFCRGEYEIGASVEEIRLMKPTIGSNDTSHTSKVDAGEFFIPDTFVADGGVRKRRIWHARDHCVIAAHD
ncbi:hypercellular protein HypA [Talaromyces stipitatus ATCC 10500]|uniref:Hypercellular protein HypA n=1 Tax=Talaromyces stipitatus (strain ATCC 10500 / CBS 375.48 / QM 6759 / NRRL 1006) TaxID=441959 RepID=B8M6E8_TALSN|nr:hypercellular protein HypA [Talaromyces stipitatus ATCC 10500]EED19323.1 hypercellular protein HypA [Talaromyces stipitatus ATCC 10500]